VVSLLALLISAVTSAICSGVAAGATCPTVTYHSAPTLHAQAACENLGVNTQGTTPGTYLFLTQGGAYGAGAGIFQDNGTLVWWLQTGTAKDHDMTEVQYQGQPYIALWTGGPAAGGAFDSGTVTLYNEHYQVAGQISIGNAYGANGIDLHAFQITPQGDALVGSDTLSWRKVNRHWEWVLGYLVEKWSLVSDASGIHLGQLLFAWNAINDVRLSDSHIGDPGAGHIWDYFHGNAITQAPDGDLLVSGRNTWGIYEIDDRRGTSDFDHVYWQVGAAHDHRLAQPWCYQHDISPLGHGVYSLYDDGGTGPGCMPGSTEHPSRGVIFSVNTSKRPVGVRLIRAYTHNPPIYSGFTGSMQMLANGDALIDWANIPEITEYNSSGQDVMDLSLSGWSYRGYRWAWDGQPTQAPAVAAQPTATGTDVWASWNGSTEVAAWQVLAGTDASHLTPIGSPTTKTGFETSIQISGQYNTVAVQALSSSGAVLATSAAIAG
jgi:Arylsulfotransferase (ASST)